MGVVKDQGWKKT